MNTLRIFVTFLFILFKRKLKIIAAVLLTAMILFVICFFLFKNFSKDVLQEGLVGTFQERDLPEQVTNLISDGLVTIDKNGKPQPQLAESWKSNKDATEYTITLKDNLYWTDGTKVNVADIAFSVGSDPIIVNDRTVKFKLKDSFSPFVTFLDKPILKKNSLIGIGPYEVTQIKKETIFINKVTLKNKNDKDSPNIVIKFYPNERIAKNALKLGEIQAFLGINEPSELLTQNHIRLMSKIDFSRLVTIFYNTADKTLSDDNLRLALSYASPVIPDEQTAQTSIPESSWAFNKDVRDYLNNPEQAASYLKKAKPDKSRTITLTATSSLKTVGEQVVAEWNKRGIKSVLRVESGIPQNFQALLITQNIPLDPDQYSLWHSTQKDTNISRFSNPRVDKDLEDGRKTTDEALRKTRYADFQKVLLDHSPATFLYFPKYNVVYFKKIESTLQKVIDQQLN